MVGTMCHRLATPTGLVIALAILLAWATTAEANKVRIKDIADFRNEQQVDLIGYGLVIGLDGTGDGTGTQFTVQSLVNMMQRMGMTVDVEKVKVKNVAAVMVTGRITSSQTEGGLIDVTVSSIGDAKSLQGGTLLMTPLSGLDGTVRAVAQGPVSIGGFNIQVDESNKLYNNYTLVGRVPNGGKVTAPPTPENATEREIYLSLRSPDYTTAHRVAERINIKYGLLAYPVDAGSVRLVVPDSLSHPTARIEFLSDVGQLQVVPDNPARVVINERTGTIVAGEHVTIDAVAIAHGSITVNIESTPVISQPEPFSQGETVVTSDARIQVQDEKARVVELKPAVYLSDVANALNRIGATPRDIIAIFQALKQSGALRAELVIL
ncbi:MAG TPA: flagellar basal body P-ring protein FlgI [candidate division Zixibacteria bacterium]|nr:flagellar basal body P-ring protein FlgI [candidate division Zixibacteria bacterium]MDM7972659.1 flagellar basal body P-ring protein FlgI [candidate division Zixibacteria bacterium]HOD65425.1 flagellar basal body P-ring protein FlgI [candidate division Zixibacteria bacterium]HOZ06766.1 flagellar basal body P-ring protein FlgI [candidate division Zixibacteria bacterium]HPC10646.1 flagellar basal body P-ring protein FlgI [candidate division Zixibacteria bacterium]